MSSQHRLIASYTTKQVHSCMGIHAQKDGVSGQRRPHRIDIAKLECKLREEELYIHAARDRTAQGCVYNTENQCIPVWYTQHSSSVLYIQLVQRWVVHTHTVYSCVYTVL